MTITGVSFPFQKFLNLLLSLWVPRASESLKQNVLKLLVYKIHRGNLEVDQTLDFDMITIVTKDEEIA